jgi:adenosylmethionine-8-amino-7-oxononanoate aminotransferase
MTNNQEIMQQDLAVIWHPCTQMKDHERLPLIPIKSAKGVYLYDFEGNSYIDAISSWWVNLFGHCNEYINQKV